MESNERAWQLELERQREARDEEVKLRVEV